MSDLPRGCAAEDGLWLQIHERLEPRVRSVQLISPHQAREIAELKDVDLARSICDDVMRHLGFERARLGRVEFYIRKTIREKRHVNGQQRTGDPAHNRAQRRARDRA